jgi:nicotinamide-nucleotide amidase
MPPDTLTTLVAAVGAKLRASGWMLTTAESCTGGWVAQAVTAIAGSSDWFERGFVTYSDAAKQEMLGVSARTLAAHGAVSEQTARDMATGALAHSRAQVALAITGIAGPGGGSPEKPVGMVCFAWAAAGDKISVDTRYFEGDRESVRRQSVIVALQGLAQLLEG